MSKKKFTDGLETLFGLVAQKEDLPEDSPLLVTTTVDKLKKKKKSSIRKTVGKSFTSDLDSLFKQAVKETIDNKVKEQEALKTARQERARRLVRKPKSSGLDSLLRQTIQASRIEVESAVKKRVTFVFDKSKLSKLKTIARREKSYLKDIIGEVVSEFIDKYEKESGVKPDIQFRAE